MRKDIALFSAILEQHTCWETRVGCTVKIWVATLCLKNIGGTGKNMDAVRGSGGTKSVVLDMR
jgi:ribosomal protein L28